MKSLFTRILSFGLILNAFTVIVLISCASLPRDQKALPPRDNNLQSLVVLNLYRMNNVIGTDVEATFRLVNLTDRKITPKIDLLTNGFYIGSLKLVEVPPGEYKVKYVEFRSIGKRAFIRLDCEDRTNAFTVTANSIIYLGNIGIDNGNVDFFTQKYDFLRMDEKKQRDDLNFLVNISKSVGSEWVNSEIFTFTEVFPVIMENRL